MHSVNVFRIQSLCLSFIRSRYRLLVCIEMCVCVSVRLCGVLINILRNGKLATAQALEKLTEMAVIATTNYGGKMSKRFMCDVLSMSVQLYGGTSVQAKCVHIQCSACIPKYHFEFLLIVLQQHVK